MLRDGWTRGGLLGFILSLMVVLLVAGPSQVQAACTANDSSVAGFEGRLSTVDHNTGGTVTILDDCTFSVSNFSYDGLAPAPYWHCASAADDASLREGWRVSDTLLTTGNGSKVTFSLNPDASWAGCKVLYVWCEIAQANFADVALPARVGERRNLSCLALEPGRFNVEWELNGSPSNATEATITLSAALPDEQSWMAIGFSDPTLPAANMIGSDVVVAGLVGGKPVAFDFYLQSRDQCNYGGTQNMGVCPDTGYANDPVANNVKVLGGSRISGVTSVTFTRVIKASDMWDHVWSVNGSTPAVWAHGPLGEKSTVTQPIVLYHGPSQRSGTNFTLNLGATSACAAPVTGTSANDTSANFTAKTSPELVGRTTFEVTTGTNLNYPNPPGWGLSYHIDGLESPVVYVYRGVQYNFTIKAGPTHPFYLTSDAVGGNSNISEIVYAGGPASNGTADTPNTLLWTPNATVPSSLYYGCYKHQKLGWKLEVVDPPADGQAAPRPCSKTHPYVGFKGALSQLEHNLAGDVTVVDDCTFMVTNFRYDGKGPAAYWFGAPSEAAIGSSGIQLTQELAAAGDGSVTVIVRLPPGASWDKISTLSLWCKDFSANFGSVDLVAQGGAGTSCMLQSSAGEQAYSGCVRLPGVTPYYQLYYNLSMAANGNAQIDGAIEVETAQGSYASLAFPTTPGQMVGSSAVIVRSLPAGMEVKDYFLGAQAASGVTSPSKLKFSNMKASTSNSGTRQTATFTVELPESYASLASGDGAARRRLLAGGTPVLYSSGPLSSDGAFLPHGSGGRASTTVDFSQGPGSAPAVAASDNTPTLRKVHGVLMALSWGLMIPLGVFIARCFRDGPHQRPWQFQLHRACQTLGFLMGCAGFGIGIYLGNNSTAEYKLHRSLGITVIVLGGLQILAIIARPNPTSRFRKGWNLVHWWFGRAAILLALININEGFNIVESLGNSVEGYEAAFWALFGAIFVASIVKDGINYLSEPPLPPLENVAKGDPALLQPANPKTGGAPTAFKRWFSRKHAAATNGADGV